ncbi:MAG: LysR family transcriptional regulator [Anderseniella sp.]
MDTNWLEDFVSFARSLNFTKAAAERNITQSAFSRRIQSLETWLGVELIDRKTFPATLSPAGDEFLPTAKRMIQALHRGRDDVRAKVGVDIDTIRFAAPHSISIHNLMPLVSDLETIIPSLKTHVTSDNLHNCYEQLSERNCDFLMCYRFPGIPVLLDEQKFQFIEIGTERLVPVYSHRKELAKGWQLPGWNSPPMPYLRYSSGSYLGAVAEQLFSNNQPNLLVRHTDAFAEALKSLCLQGAGLAWLPEASIKSELESEELLIAGSADWCVDLKLVIYTEPDNHKHQSEIAWKFFSQMSLGTGNQ